MNEKKFKRNTRLMQVAFLVVYWFVGYLFFGCDIEATFTVQVEDKHYICNDCGHEFYRDSTDYNKICPICNSSDTEVLK